MVKVILCLAVVLLSIFACKHEAYSGSEVLLSLQYDSNISRSLNHPQGDFITQLRLSLDKSPTGEARREFIYNIYLQALGYKEYTKQNALEIGATGGLAYHINPKVTASLFAGTKARAVDDTAQSLIELSLNSTLTETLSESLQLTQSYSYLKGFAQDDIYSYGIHRLGLGVYVALDYKQTLGLNYCLSLGDTFRSVNSRYPIKSRNQAPATKAKISWLRDSSVINEKATVNTVGLSWGLNINKDWQFSASYNHDFINSKSGSTEGSLSAISVMMRF